jgi:hypothetical protein
MRIINLTLPTPNGTLTAPPNIRITRDRDFLFNKAASENLYIETPVPDLGVAIVEDNGNLFLYLTTRPFGFKIHKYNKKTQRFTSKYLATFLREYFKHKYSSPCFTIEIPGYPPQLVGDEKVILYKLTLSKELSK